MIENTTILKKEDTLIHLKKIFRIVMIIGAVITVVSFIMFFTSNDLLNNIGSYMISIGLWLVVFGFLFPLFLKFSFRGLPNETTFKYQFDEDIKIDVNTNGIENSIKLDYSAITKYKFRNKMHHLYNSKFVFYIVKDEGFKSEEDKQNFLNKVRR